jgi:molybdenum cofactor biosynthesis enzyme MoaA
MASALDATATAAPSPTCASPSPTAATTSASTAAPANVGAQYAELPIADYLRLIRLFVSLGIEKVRLTGGEPSCAAAWSKWSRNWPPAHPDPANKLDIALTTNGHLLEDLAQPLKDAGLSRITVSMDAVDKPPSPASPASPAASSASSPASAPPGRRPRPHQVNCVLLRGFNDDQIEAFAHFARRENVIVRFIEFMPLEEDRLWTPEIVVPLREIVARLNAVLPARRCPPTPPAKPPAATFADGVGEIGIIAPVTQAFCGALQPHPPHLRRQNPHLPLLAISSTTSTPACAGAIRRDLRAFILRTVQGKRKPATTSASPASSSPPAPWSTSAANRPLISCSS